MSEDCEESDDGQSRTAQVFAMHVLRAAGRTGATRAQTVFGRRGRPRFGGGAGDWPGACGRASLRRQTADRRASPLHSAIPRGCHDGTGTARNRSAAEMVAGLVARGNGQERDCDRDPVDRPAWSVVRRQCRGGAHPRASAQRIRREARARPPRPLRPVCSHRATRRGRQPQGDRIRLRDAEGGRHRALDQLPDQVSRRSFVCPGLPRTQPAQGGGLCPPDYPGLLPRARSRHTAVVDRIRNRFHADHCAPRVHRNPR
jgi:hypothetical protein